MAAKKKNKRNKKKKKKHATKLFDNSGIYTVSQQNPEDMETLMVLAEEEFIEP
jgi:hypothetical protein